MANKKDREQAVIYRAWCPEYGQTMRNGHDWGAISIEAAGMIEAKMNYCQGRDRIVVHVASAIAINDPASGRVLSKTRIYEVVVDVVHRPDFEAQKATLLREIR